PTTVIAVLVAFSVAEGWAASRSPRGERPEPLAKSLALASGLGLLATAILAILDCGKPHPGGLLLAGVGVALRVRAIVDLGGAFTSALAPGSRLVRSGIYGWLRHP